MSFGDIGEKFTVVVFNCEFPMWPGFFYISVSPLGNRLCRIQDLHGHFPGSGNARGLVQASFPQFCTCTTDRQYRWKNPQGIFMFSKFANLFCKVSCKIGLAKDLSRYGQNAPIYLHIY